jgi:hypothetical protein
LLSRRAAIGLFILAALNVVVGAALSIATNGASAQKRWPGFLDLGRRYPWWATGVLMATAVILAVSAIALERRSIATTELVGGGQPSGPSVVRLVWCLHCGLRRRARLYHGFVGGGPCPKCGRFLILGLDKDGRVTNHSENYGVSYRATPRLFGLLYHVSDVRYSKESNGKEWPVVVAVFICPKCEARHRLEVRENRKTKHTCHNCSLPFTVKAEKSGVLTSIGNNRKITYKPPRNLFGYFWWFRILTNEELQEPSRSH